MQAAALRIELRLPAARSLKEKRAVLKPLVEGLRRSASVAEIDHQDTWQRAALGVAVVGRTQAAVDHLIDEIRRYVEADIEIEVMEMTVSYLEGPE